MASSATAQTARFFVVEKRPFGRDSTRIIEVHPDLEQVRVLRGKNLNVLHEIPWIHFADSSEEDDMVLAQWSSSKSVRFQFSSQTLKQQFLRMMSQARLQSPHPFPPPETERFETVGLLPGETIVHLADHLSVCRAQCYLVHSGRLIVTTYRLLFSTSPDLDAADRFVCVSFSVIPHLSIAEVDLSRDTSCLTVHVKDGREVTYDVDVLDDESKDHLVDVIEQRAFASSHDQCFALLYCSALRVLPDCPTSFEPDTSNVSSYNFCPRMIDDLKRVGLLVEPCGPWRLSEANTTYRVCSSYPSALVVPSKVSDDVMVESAQFRSQSRLPVACWANPNGCVIMRSSQPRAGITGLRSTMDEMIINEARLANPNSRTFMIFDLRSKMNVIGNQLKGKGSETPTYYANCVVLFMGMKNIHAIRESFQQVVEMCRNLGDDRWYAKLDSTRYLHNVQALLKTSIRVAQSIHEDRTSVLIHCSDGWDRTCQVSAMTQLLLDPFYRTLSGFMVLIQKEWIEFGHRFATRHAGVGRGQRSKAEISPIFMLFLDAVHQVKIQCPEEFEFTLPFLCVLVDESYGGRFGNFLCDSAKEIADSHIQTRTMSIWHDLEQRRADLTDATFRPTDKPIYQRVKVSVRRLTLWNEYFCRWDLDRS
ncbi:Myotubularin phosphatase domain-containing protein [Plasmodiophora brassicae]